MGPYLSAPVFEPDSSSGSGRALSFGASSVQGWRQTQEDAHNCIIDFDVENNCSLFAVYDGHGGSEVAEYCSLHLPDFIKKLSSYKSGDLKQALIDAFVKFDETLVSPEALQVLKQLAPFASSDDDEVTAFEEISNLQKEAKIPLEVLLKGYIKLSPENRKEALAQAFAAHNGKKKELENEKAGNGSDEAHDDKIKSKKSTKDEESSDEENSKTSNEASSDCPETSAGGSASTSEPTAGASSSSAKNDSGAGSSSGASNRNSSPGARVNRAAAQMAKIMFANAAEYDDDDEEEEEEDDDDDEEDSEEESGSDNDNDDDDNNNNNDEDSSEEEGDDDDDSAETFESDVPGYGSGCTAVVALLKDDVLFVANAGDSRAVICRKGKAIDMSIDHKPEDATERMRIERAGGKITDDGRVNGGLNLSRAIGDHVYKQNDSLPLIEQMITSLPDIQSLSIDRSTDEFMVLACDGIWNCMTSQEVCDFVSACLKKGDKLTDICEQLFRRCIAPDSKGDGTGCDNMTCIVVRFEPKAEKRQTEKEGEEEAEHASKKLKTEESKD